MPTNPTPHPPLPLSPGDYVLLRPLCLQEDGGEVNNVFDGNLGILTRRGTGALVPEEATRTATFWFLHPTNRFVNNVAAGSQDVGISWALGPESRVRFGGLQVGRRVGPIGCLCSATWQQKGAWLLAIQL